MLIIAVSVLLSLTVQLQDSIENLELIVTNSSGLIVGQLESPTAGEYVFDQLDEGRYTLRAELDGVVMALVPEIDVPTAEPIEIRIQPDGLLEPRMIANGELVFIDSNNIEQRIPFQLTAEGELPFGPLNWLAIPSNAISTVLLLLAVSIATSKRKIKQT